MPYRRKTIENGIIYDGHIPFAKQADSGKIPVVNAKGEWELQEAPSGGGTEIFNVVFTASWNDQDQKVITASKTAAEILAAQQAGKYITANYRTVDFDEGTRAISIIVKADYDDSPYCDVKFLTLYAEGSQATSNDTMEFTVISWDSSQNDWFVKSYIYSLSPSE